MRLKKGTLVKFKDCNEVNSGLRGKIGTVIGEYRGEDRIVGEINYKVRMLDPQLSPQYLGVFNWDNDFWTPVGEFLEEVTKLEKVLL